MRNIVRADRGSPHRRGATLWAGGDLGPLSWPAPGAIYRVTEGGIYCYMTRSPAPFVFNAPYPN